MGDDSNDRTMWCGNLADDVTEELLFELFLQAGPLDHVRIPSDNSGKKKNFSFIKFKHVESVPYTIDLMNGIRLNGRPLRLQTRPGSIHQQKKNNGLMAPPPVPPGGGFHRSQSAPNMGRQQWQGQPGSPFGGQGGNSPFGGNSPLGGNSPDPYNQPFRSPGMNRSDSFNDDRGRSQNQRSFDDRDNRRDRSNDRRDRSNDRRDNNRDRDRGRSYDDRDRSFDDRDRSRDRGRFDDQDRNQRSYDERDRDRDRSPVRGNRDMDQRNRNNDFRNNRDNDFRSREKGNQGNGGGAMRMNRFDQGPSNIDEQRQRIMMAQQQMAMLGNQQMAMLRHAQSMPPNPNMRFPWMQQGGRHNF